MRVSDIGMYVQCESMALHSPRRESRTHVAAYVGTMAHGALSGTLPVEVPRRITYDAITRTHHQAKVQAMAIQDEARRLLTAQGWGVLERERALERDGITGHLDIRAYHSEHGEAIIDLKTGAGIGAAFLQVGGYISLDSDNAGVWPSVEWGGVLHIPRRPIGKDVAGTLEMRSGRELRAAWQRWYARYVAIIDGNAHPTYSPGLHCRRCNVSDCPVRV